MTTRPYGWNVRVAQGGWMSAYPPQPTCEAPVILPDFLDAAECAAVIEAGERMGLKRSRVLDSKSPRSSGRTSKNVFLGRDDPACLPIFEKVERLLNIPRSHFEDLQVLRYTKRQKYDAHFDSCTKCDDGEDVLRTDTILINLNEGFEGGGTAFPKAKFTSVPRRGQALWWKNIDDMNKPLPCSLHAGTPVTRGTKYACNVWIRRAPFST